MLRRIRPLLLLAACAASFACARAMDVGSDPRPVYRLTVDNRLAEPMIVSYADTRGQALLGTVPAARSEFFTIASPASATVTVTARNAAGTRTAGPYQVQLIAGETVTVQLR